ncbi:MAG: hypothetical protein EB127_10235 [Alphaproteobacteria bacterium]|nr:hypothetical protein [Alphaproteobacteria bacterium]
MSVRRVTNLILGMIEEGALDRDAVIRACLCYMSEADVADMAHCNEFIDDDDDDDDDDSR